jgi:pyruvate dehydrogenase E1 component alpha subunit
MAEIMGKVTGYSRGRCGSVQLMDPKKGIIAATGVVGQGPPIAVGAALANKVKAHGKIVVVFFGDGATNNGMFFESLNCAAYLKLPLIFVCENNGYSTSVKTAQTMANTQIAQKARSLGVPARSVDGTNVKLVFQAMTQLLGRARQNSEPGFLECRTVRLLGHTVADGAPSRYRTSEEIQSIQLKCPLMALRGKLLSAKFVTRERLQLLEGEVELEILKAVKFAKRSKSPPSADLFKNLYA